MDRVSFDGVEYLKASVAAKDFKYTTDYIGQLCRSKKVDARMVGRTWFVRVASLTKHKQAKYNKTAKVSRIRSSAAPKIKSVVPSVPTAKSVKQLHHSLVTPGQESGKRLLKVVYERDEESLLPTLIKKHVPPPTALPVKPAGAQKVKISGPSSTTAFKATEVPSVVLSGKITVRTYDTILKKEAAEKESTGDSFKNKDTSDQVNVVKKDTTKEPKVHLAEKEVVEVTNSTAEDKNIKPAKQIKKTAVLPVKSFTPNSVSSKDEGRMPVWVSLSPLIATFVAFLGTLLLLASSSLITVSQNSYDASLVVQVSALARSLTQ